ncbi:hypothetical protein HDU67_002219 [Dinochytrium kinnereticum]|nr:hypothetical protein HDU67_002219 [Dinochytrium kinnereticum]
MSNPHTFLSIRRGVLQFAIVKPLLAILAVLFKVAGVYHEAFPWEDYDDSRLSSRIALPHAIRDVFGIKDILQDYYHTLRGTTFHFAEERHRTLVASHRRGAARRHAPVRTGTTTTDGSSPLLGGQEEEDEMFDRLVEGREENAWMIGVSGGGGPRFKKNVPVFARRSGGGGSLTSLEGGGGGGGVGYGAIETSLPNTAPVTTTTTMMPSMRRGDGVAVEEEDEDDGRRDDDVSRHLDVVSFGEVEEEEELEEAYRVARGMVYGDSNFPVISTDPRFANPPVVQRLIDRQASVWERRVGGGGGGGGGVNGGGSGEGEGEGERGRGEGEGERGERGVIVQA